MQFFFCQIEMKSCLFWLDTRLPAVLQIFSKSNSLQIKLEMWANAQSDGRPAEYRWRPLFNAANFG